MLDRGVEINGKFLNFLDWVERLDLKRLIVPVAGAKVGGTAGWTVNAAANTSLATMAASQTNGRLILPVVGLMVGQRIKSANLIGQIESAGAAASISFVLRKTKLAAADVVDSDVLVFTPALSVTADTVISSANSNIAGDYTVLADEAYFFDITATTAAATDIALVGAQLVIAES